MKIDIIFYVDYFAANIRKPTQVSGFLFGGPYGPKFELFQQIIM